MKWFLCTKSFTVNILITTFDILVKIRGKRFALMKTNMLPSNQNIRKISIYLQNFCIFIEMIHLQTINGDLFSA